MFVTIRACALVSPRVRGYLEARLRALAGSRACGARVWLWDERCRIRLRPVRRPAIVSEATAASVGAAIDAALDRLVAQLGRKSARRRSGRPPPR